MTLLYLISSNVELPAINYPVNNGYPVNDGTNIPIGEITKSMQIGQTFVAERSNLSRIDILFATYKRENTEDILFHLRKKFGSNNDIVLYRFNPKFLEDNRYFSITFPEIPDSEGKVYYFYIESPTSYSGNAVTIWYLPNSSYTQGNLYINGMPSKGSLVFRPYYESNMTEYLNTLLRRLEVNKPWFYNKYTFITLFIIYISSLFFAGLLIENLQDSERERDDV